MITLIVPKTDEIAASLITRADENTVKFPENTHYTNKSLIEWVEKNAVELNTKNAVILTGNEHVFNTLRVMLHNGELTTDELRIEFHTENSTITITAYDDGSLSDWPEGFMDDWDNELMMLLEPVK